MFWAQSYPKTFSIVGIAGSASRDFKGSDSAALNHWLLRNRCRPYYIFQADAVVGTSHFRTSTETGIEIIQQLRGWTSGLAVPHYVVDLPRGGGKVSLQPDYLRERDGRTLTFENYRGETFSYDEG